MIMTPALLLPLCFVDTANINNGFDGNFANAQLQDWQSEQCYFQKWQFSDTLKLQLISDEELSDLKIYNINGSIADTVIWTVSPLLLPSYPDYRIYEIEYSFANLSEGKYIIQQDQFESEAIQVAQSWDNTVLISYKNIINDYSVVFSTGFDMEFRIEGWIGNFKPKNERDVYNDQRRNLTQLNSVAYRQFSLYIGYKYGVHQKFLDKVNIITQCDQLSIDGVPYQPLQDAEFEVENNTDNNFIGGSIDIEPVSNNYLRFVTSGNLPNETYTPNQMVTPYPNIGADFTVAGLFKFASVLEYIAIYKVSENPITLKFGIAPDGNEIGEIELNDLGNTLLVDYAFTEAKTVYVSGVNDGDDITIWFVWKQLDALPVPINPTPQGDELGAGLTALWFEPSPGDFLANWDIVTGLGKANTKWVKWCILGTNGTLPDLNPRDIDNAYFRQIGNIADNYATLGTVLGANQKLIPKEALPAEALDIVVKASQYTAWNRSSGSARPLTGIGNIEANPSNVIGTAKTGNMGSGAEFDVTPKTIISLYIFKLVD